MGMYTYINEQDIKRWLVVEDPEIDDLLQEARKINPNILIATSEKWVKSAWFKKRRLQVLYSIRINNGGEARILNFPQEHDWSINPYVTKSYIMTYLYGFLNGANEQIGIQKQKTINP